MERKGKQTRVIVYGGPRTRFYRPPSYAQKRDRVVDSEPELAGAHLCLEASASPNMISICMSRPTPFPQTRTTDRACQRQRSPLPSPFDASRPSAPLHTHAANRPSRLQNPGVRASTRVNVDAHKQPSAPPPSETSIIPSTSLNYLLFNYTAA